MTDPDGASPDPRARALALLRAHGATTTSFQVLEPDFRYWFHGDAVVGFVDTGGAWVAAGAPVVASDRLAEVAAAFVDAAARAGRRACFFAVEQPFVDATGYPALHIGEQPTWLPAQWDETLATSRSLRYQVRRARDKGVTVRALTLDEVRGPESPARQAVEGLIRRWTAHKSMAPMGFLVDLRPFDFPEERWHLVAEHGGAVVGFLAAVPIYARAGWFFEDLLRAHDAPNGTAELLVDAGMREAAARGAEFVTLGVAPLAGHVAAPLRLASVLGAPLYDFSGLHAFKSKLRPAAWHPVSLCAAPGRSRWVALLDSLVAFARGSLVRFGFATLTRGPVGVIWLLTALLILWTPLLAAAPVDPWFPSATLKWAWVAFDVALAAGLVALGRRYHEPLAVALAVAVTVDLALTLAQALTFNLLHLHGAAQLALTAVACAGPALATLALWGLVRRRRALSP